ncbi:MAG: hypothetical protein RLZZ385_770 [Pseudomonadota bacterium]|jgi:orotidine-5'-phosphate decarboxylase
MVNDMNKSDNKSIIVALDFPDAAACLHLLDQLDPGLCRVKVGKELFTAAGPQLIRQIHSLGFEVFLDLKFHDIPNTVAGAVRAAAELGVWMLNVHASGGRAMMEAAVKVMEDYGADERPLLIAVTVLTSLGQEDLLEVGIHDTPGEQVKRLALLAEDCGLQGVVCSAAETVQLRAALPDNFCLVTPGIRRPEDASGDQKRVVGPAQALRNGSDYLVVGRPITQAASPREALAQFYALTGES